MSLCLYQSTSNHLENSAPDPGAVSLSFLLDGFGDEVGTQHSPEAWLSASGLGLRAKEHPRPTSSIHVPEPYNLVDSWKFRGAPLSQQPNGTDDKYNHGTANSKQHHNLSRRNLLCRQLLLKSWVLL